MTRAAFAMSRLANPEKQLNRLARRAVHSPFVRNVVESLAGRVMVIGVDRLDYSKGIPLRMEAFRRFLSTHRRSGPVSMSVLSGRATIPTRLDELRSITTHDRARCAIAGGKSTEPH